MATLTLRNIKNAPLTNAEVDGNFSNLNDDKLEIDGSNSMTGKLTTVVSSTARASILLTPGAGDPSSPVSGDVWNNSGNIKFYDGSSIYVLTTTAGNQTLTNKTLTSPIVSDGIYFEGTTADAFETYLTVVNPTADRTVTIPDATTTMVGTDVTQTLTNKTINLASNTLTATSAQIAAAVTDETGSGSLVFGTSPTIVTPTIVQINSGSTFTVDAGADINLDAGGADVILKDDSTEYGRFTNNAGELQIKSGAAATLAMTFSGANVTVAGNLASNGNTTIGDTSGDTLTINAATINPANIAAGTDNTVVVYNGSTLVTDEIDSRVWGSSLVDYTGTNTNNQIATFTDGNTITGESNLTFDGSTLAVTGALTVTGNLTVNGTTTTVNSTTVTLDDPIITLGGDVAPVSDDNKDRGVEFRWHNGSAAKVGFFGFDDSTGKLTFIPDATNTSEVFSGTKGTVDANIEWADVLSKPDPVVTVTLTGDVTGSANTTLTDLASGTITVATNIAANSVALGTDTTGNYVGTITAGTGLSSTGATTGEGVAHTISLSHLGIQNLVDPNADRILFWDDSAGATAWGTAGTGISISGTTISNSGVTSAVAGTGVNVSGGTGAVTFSIGQAVATSSNVQFNSLGVGTAGSGVAGEIRATNEITAYYSDERLKNLHGTIPNAMSKVLSLNGYYFTENEVAKSLGYTNDKMQVGLSAQEVQAVLPEAVCPAPIDEQYLSVKYEKMVPLLLEAIKELKAEVDELKKNCNCNK